MSHSRTGATTLADTLRLHAADDVVIALRALPAGALVETANGAVTVRAPIPPGHKLAIRARSPGEPVHRYGQVIGFATDRIRIGDHVHVHNLGVGDPRPVYEPGRDLGGAAGARTAPAEPGRAFQGFARADGRVGTRNYVAVIPTVNCAATVSQAVRERFRAVARELPGVDGVVALAHRGGCGHVASGEAIEQLGRVLAGYARHPNVAGYVLVSLGCELNQPATLIDERLSTPGRPDQRPPVVVIQEAGGTRKAIEAVVAEVARLLPRAAAARRTPQPLSKLLLATNCGGSDGYSGITANPALGWAVDELVRHGGTALLGETTEIYGAEALLVRRAVSPAVADRLLARIAWWRRHLQAHGGDVDHNPSPGNLAGGISTVLEKSLGGVAKGGTSPLADAVGYAEPVQSTGLVFMDTPGYDPASVTGMVAGGANLVAFTTGRGSVFGCKPVPSLKLATTSDLYRRMEEDMDVDCGGILDGRSIEEVGREVFDELVAVASGKRTKSELLGVGDEEFDPWMPGPTL